MIRRPRLEVPRRSSPFRALVWKEWRQQRWIFFSLMGLAYAPLVFSRIVGHDERDLMAWQAVLQGIAAFIGIVGVIVRWCRSDTWVTPRDGREG